MVRARMMLMLGLAATLLPGVGLAQGDDAIEPMIRLLSPELRRIDQRLEEIAKEMEPLPDVKKEPWGSRYGHRSGDLPSETTPDWLQVDLGEPRTVDMVALMPVNLAYLGEKGAGYGFPKRFRVEISDFPDMSDAVVLVDRSGADVPNPGKYPLVFGIDPARGRYLRITSLKHDFIAGAYFWALEELMAMEGLMNVAVAKDKGIVKSSSMDLFPLWSSIRIIDGQSSLGMPVDVTEPSPTQGYLSDRLNMTEAGDPPPAPLRKWCAVDLGEPHVIEQIRVLPLESDAYEVVGGRGFPRSFNLQLANDPDFGEVVWQGGRGSFSLGYPAGSSIDIWVPDVEARYVRVLAETMWSRDDWQVIGLSELQVYGSGRNLALGKRAFAKDVADKEAGWSPAYLTDGFTSRYRLIEWPRYLALMGERGRLEREKATLENRRAAKISFGKGILGGVAVVLALLVVAGWIWMVVRHRTLRSRGAEQLRQQIARDLHDDIGSNLGGIVLLSEIGSRHSPDEHSRDDFESIRRAAEDASLAMRDIIWLIQRDPVGLRDFVTRMRQAARMILSDANVTLEVEPAEFQDRKLGLLFRRHVFLAFKETLNNVRKHARTDRVAVKVEIDAKRLRFTVRDEGAGFDPETTHAAGLGLGNLKRRASRLGGGVRVDSAPGKGTEVVFEAPFSK